MVDQFPPFFNVSLPCKGSVSKLCLPMSLIWQGVMLFEESFAIVFSMVLIESVKFVRLTLQAMTLLSLTMPSWFIMDLKLKKDSTHLRMMKMHATENCSGNLKGNSKY